MKLIRYGQPGNEKTGVEINGTKFDTSGFGQDYDEHFFATDGLIRLKEFINTNKSSLTGIAANERLACPVARPSKIVCVGLNYKDHAAEMQIPLPHEPVVFLKSTSAITGPFDDIIIPKDSVKTDWEVELAIVIGKKASYISAEDAMEHIAGYCLHNDVSEREFQLERGGTWDKGKGCDTFAPLGPYMVTTDEISDIHGLRIWLKLNGQLMQDGNTANLIFNVPYMVSYISRFMTLLPGDVISTGTPAGVGMGYNPPVYLKPGDTVTLGIDGLGESCQRVVAFE
ncbi:fumarylacetoacetate hydrolase family protein [Mucilaginibacter segetis]|uniref:Fumarylacetoacetate hydrolase family protein n=1 Tax=Mucilaginibacter segetis TaxID=2793071 RepID=A0A934PYB6_9SPHI|nr:fumarylacetoacetate hydrolase family protein [Mucilaginibacter segetis]MBK0381311.1 fumarylacetoacetate hydrolase family protein [Mucilaginibacter segetis]